MSNGGRVNEFPRNVIGNQRLPLGRVIDKRLNVFLQQVRGVRRHIVSIEVSGSVVESAPDRRNENKLSHSRRRERWSAF
jgi:hypothetical protein